MSEKTFEWTRDIVSEFIEMYKNRSCLWKIRDKTYLNKHLKSAAYNEILQFLETKNNSDVKVTIREIKAKIQNLRNAFRKESKKIEDSIRSGADSEDVYTPTLWYYPLLLFTQDQDTDLASLDKAGSSDLDNVENNIENTTDEYDTKEGLLDDITTYATTFAAAQENDTSVEFKYPQKPKAKKRKNNDYDTDIREFMKACTKTLSAPERQSDEYDGICMVFAAKMRKMEPRQQIWAESLIHKIITKGLLGQLNDCVEIVNCARYVQSPEINIKQRNPSPSTTSTPLASPLSDESSSS